MTPGQRTLLAFAAWHLGVLAGLALWLMLCYPTATPAVAVMLVLACACEVLPMAVRRWFAAELLLILGVLCGIALAPPGIVGWHAVAAMWLAWWVLAPSRLHCLRWAASLALAELLIHGRFGTPELGIATAAAWLAPLAVLSLWGDAWLSGRYGARRGAAGWRWVVVPGMIALMAALLAISTSGPAVAWSESRALERAQQREPSRSSRGSGQIPASGATNPRRTGSGAVAPDLSFGDHQQVEVSGMLQARLVPPPGWSATMTYVRLRALSRLQLRDDGSIGWDAVDSGRGPDARQPWSAPLAEDQDPWQVLLAAGGGAGEALMRPDGATGIRLDPLRADIEGNWYRGADGRRRYLVGAGAPDGPVAPMVLAAASQVDPAFDALPWDDLIPASWHQLPRVDAVRLVVNRIADRSRYRLTGLPIAPRTRGGALATFLFGERDQRVGHCQHFSSAAAVALRRLRIPARVVVGYASNEEEDGVLLVRSCHAHAWVEWLDQPVAAPATWIRAEATPGEAFEIAHTAALAARQQPEPPASEPPTPDASASAPPATATTDVKLGAATWPWMIGAAALAAVLWLGFRALGQRSGPTAASRQLQRLADDLLEEAGAWGLRITPGTTVTLAAQRLEQASGVALAAHAAAWERARWGGGPPPPPWPLDAVRRCRRERQDQRAPRIPRRR